MSALAERSLLDTARMLREGALCAEDVAREALDSQRRHRNFLGAYVSVDPEATLAAAKRADEESAAGRDGGVLHGIPVSVKDLFGVKGYPTYAGSPRPLPAKWERPGPLIEKVLRAHAVIVGKTHTVEFAFGGIGMNPHWDTPRNPWDAVHHRVPGGSSAGAGVTLLEGSALVAFGTDTAGSVRIPASYSGTVGLKTTAGRWSTAGVVPLSPTLDTVGLLAKDVADVERVFHFIDGAGEQQAHGVDDADLPRLSELRFIVPTDFFWDECSPGVAEGVERAMRELEGAGARFETSSFACARSVFGVFLEGGPVAPEFAEFIRKEVPQAVETLDPNVAARIENTVSTTSPEYLSRIERMRHLAARAVEELGETGMLLSPTVALTPPTVDSLADPDAYRKANLAVLRNTGVVNYLGLCALSLPVALDACGMPVGLQVIASPGMEEHLLRAARRIENTLGRMRDRLGRPPGFSPRSPDQPE